MPPPTDVSRSPGQATAFDAHALPPHARLVAHVLAQRLVQLCEAHVAAPEGAHVVERGLEEKGLAGREQGVFVEHVDGREALFGDEVLFEAELLAALVPNLFSVVELAQKVRAHLVVQQPSDRPFAVLQGKAHHDFRTALRLVQNRGGADRLVREAVRNQPAHVHGLDVRVELANCA